MKSGLEYFPLDCQLDEKFELIEAEFGLKGFAVVVKILQRIYGGEGYYCDWTKEIELLFSKRLGLKIQENEGCNFVSEIINASVKRGIFSKQLYEEYSILTSQGIQKRYLDAASRRKKVELKKPYLLLNANLIFKNVDILEENVYTNAKNVDILKQSKVEESKGKKKDISSAFADDSNEIKICNYLISKMLNNNPKAKVPEGSRMQNWAEHIDKIIRLDKHTKKEIVAVIDFCQTDSFWKSNILSTEKLRDKFDTLWLQCQGKGDKNARYSGNSTSQTPKFDKSKFLAK